VTILCNKILGEDENSQESEDMMNELFVYLESHAEFTSASEQVIREKGLL
jgi:hypothetical protein